MSFDNSHHNEKVILFTNRFPKNHQEQIYHKKIIEDLDSSESSGSSYDCNSDSSSSSDEFVILDNYTTLKPEFKANQISPSTLKRLSNNQKPVKQNVNHPLLSYKTKSLPIIFERSDESSVSSQSTLELSENESTLSDCSTSSSSVLANEINSKNSNKKLILNQSNSSETTKNSYKNSVLQLHQNQPISIEKTNSIDFSDKISPALVVLDDNSNNRNDFQMCDSLNSNQITTMCNNNNNNNATTLQLSDTHNSSSIADLQDATHQSVGMSEWTKINKSSNSLSQSTELIFNKRTPRFPVKNNYDSIENSENKNLLISPNQFECENRMRNYQYQQKKPPVSEKPVERFENNNRKNSNQLPSETSKVNVQKKPPVGRKPKIQTEHTEPITDLDDFNEGNHHLHNSNESLEFSSSSASHSSGRNEPVKTESYFKKEMLKNYTKTDLMTPIKTQQNSTSNNRLYERKQDQGKVENPKTKSSETIGLLSYQKDSPSKRSQELVGNVVKMDKTINRVTNNIEKIDNAIDKLSQFNKAYMSNLEQMSDSELSIDFETHSIGAQTDLLEHNFYDKPENRTLENRGRAQENSTNNYPKNSNNKSKPTPADDSSSSDESSTEKETSSESENSVALKPSPIHQIIEKQPLIKFRSSSPGYKSSPSKPIILDSKTDRNKFFHNPQLAHTDSDVSSLPESSVCENPENRDLVGKVKYFQRQIIKSSGHYKQPPNIEPPKKLVVEEPHLKVQSAQRPIPKPRNSIDNSLRRLSNSSSESSNFDYNGKTLSNSNNHTQISPSPGNSDSGSIISLGSNHLERKFQKGAGASARYNTKSKPNDKWGTVGSRRSHKSKAEEECASLSGRPTSNKNPVKNYMNQSRSYNNLNSLNSMNPDEKSKYGSLAALNKNYSLQDINSLCDIIRQNLNLNNHDKIRNIFNALIIENEHDKIDVIIDNFEENDRNILLELIPDNHYASKDIESIFDMTMSRTDLHNHLRPGLSMSSLSDAYYQHTIDNDRMVYWRADIEELLPPPMKPPPKPMPTNLLKSAIISPESLTHVDNMVIEVMLLEPTTFTELVTYLTKDCSKDVEKVRALFRWITTYDIKSVNFDPAAPNDTLIGVLRAIKCGQMSNNELFFRMCRYAGIHCQFISGYSKGAGYRPGMAIKDNRMFRNVWTAVYVAGAWRFVNCNWGARYLTSRHQELPSSGTLLSRTSQSQYLENKIRSDEFYFLTDAKQHIFEHFPDKKRWQLLTRPITLDQFMALPIVKSPFFNANFSFKRNYAEVLQTKKGKVTVKINMPQAVGVSVKLENRTDGTILRGLTLVRILDNQMIVVTASPSQPGKFYLSIYVNEDWKSEDNMEMACSFQVHCSEHNYDRLVTGRFPDVGVLGSTPASQNLGIIANPGVDPFVLWDERSTLKLNIAIRPGLRVGQKMMSYDRSGQNSAPCDSYALLQYQSQGRSQYHLRFPIEGFYCLTIYAGVDDPDLPDTEPMECIYRLLIDCKRAQERIPPFPRQTSRWVGFRLIEPLCQHLDLNTAYRFRILAAQCSSVSVVINDIKWVDLAVSNNGLWKGKVNTGQELENLSVYGKFGINEDDEFIKLLDYILIPKSSK